jgi:bifunctional lysine-specific demethylase and histidyl-hydroxylase NO66
MPALRSLVSVSPEVFKEEYLGRIYLLSKAEKITDQLPIATFRDGLFESIGSGGLRSSSIRIVRDGKDYNGVVGTVAPGDSGVAEPYVEARYLSPLLADGYTIVARSIHRYLQPAYELTQLLSAELGHSVRIAAYVTPPDSRGLLWHFDAHDVFIIQLEGTKIWHVAPPAVKWPIPDRAWHHLRSSERDSIIGRIEGTVDLTLTAGDVLYLPRGYLHAPQTEEQLSIHMTISVHPVTRIDVAKALIEKAADSEWWREAIDMNSLEGDARLSRDTLDAIAERMLDEGSQSSPHDIFWRARDKSREERTHLQLTSLTDQARAIRDVNSFSKYARNELVRCYIREIDGSLMLHTEVGDVSLPKSAANIISDIINSSAVERSALKESHPGPLADKVLTALLRIGILSPYLARNAGGIDGDSAR